MNINTAKPTVAAAVLEQLREDIVRCRLKPGSKLRSDDLRARYDVGVSPLRESLSRLAVEGLVTSVGQRGFCVAPISIEDFREITRLRCELEKIAITDAIAMGDDEWESNIVRAFHHLSVMERRPKTDGLEHNATTSSQEWERRHRLFHEALLEGCGSVRLLGMIANLVDQSERYRHVAVAYSKMPRKDVQEHKAIMNAVLARDTAKSLDLLTRHLNKTVKMVAELLSDESDVAPGN